jgi:hypothetical protein
MALVLGLAAKDGRDHAGRVGSLSTTHPIVTA